jgi:hypothetical protein
MVIFNSYVKLPEGNHLILRGTQVWPIQLQASTVSAGAWDGALQHYGLKAWGPQEPGHIRASQLEFAKIQGYRLRQNALICFKKNSN